MRTWIVAVSIVLAALVGRARLADADAPAQEAPLDELRATSQSNDPSVAAPALLALAEAEDARGDYAHAVSDYRAAVTRLPSFRYAAKAMMRAALLESHSEGSWRPFAELEAVRRDPKASSDPKAIDALLASTDSFAPGPSRSEARMLCAEAYLSRLHRRANGEAALRKVIDDPQADGLVRREAANALVTALIDDRDLTGAQTTALSLSHMLDASLGQRVTELLRRRSVHIMATVDLALFALLAAVSVARATGRGALSEIVLALRKSLALVIAFAAYVAVVGGALASGYETGNAEPFVAFGLALVPVAVTARAWGAAGSNGLAPRIGRAALSASAVAAAAFLLLEAVNGQYLEGFKL